MPIQKSKYKYVLYSKDGTVITPVPKAAQKFDLQKKAITGVAVVAIAYIFITETRENKEVVAVADLSVAPVFFTKSEQVEVVKEQVLDELGQQVFNIVKTKEEKIKQYVERFAKTAMSEQQKFGIPASITLAQAILESGVGESKLATKNNNHFGIKCFSKSCKKGHCSNFTDDTHKDFCRKYETAWESFRAHSQLLQKDRYKGLYELKLGDYKGWARGLRKAGYATDPNYAEKLIYYIEFLNLTQYDK